MAIPHADTDTVPSPEQLRAMLRQAGLSYRAAARAVGVGLRTIERYLADGGHTCPYPLYFALRALCHGAPPHD